MTMVLLELLARRGQGGWFSELTGIEWTISGEWYWWIVGAFGVTVMNWIVKAMRERWQSSTRRHGFGGCNPSALHQCDCGLHTLPAGPPLTLGLSKTPGCSRFERLDNNGVNWLSRVRG